MRRYINGEEIKVHLATRPVFTSDAWRGELDGVKVQVHAMKDPEYTSIMITTSGTLEGRVRVNHQNVPDENDASKKILFQYLEIIYNHFQYRYVVDAHNSIQMDPICLKETWKPARWLLQVLAFYLAITEVNC
eukprot:CAMPEP_0195507428 /NCGR_PEP_ID=MMETSP0794_2-20130614/886_1 /TAXON_ID=515487 /ORGANISM="Stephanopyxis turris, Strain CCMP 815" /LENGTH=132 /DNA_ID=CAMNT_0040634109 /DNA_START=1212 /DNA_END=1610 /DNA_ORIENTATION=+